MELLHVIPCTTDFEDSGELVWWCGWGDKSRGGLVDCGVLVEVVVDEIIGQVVIERWGSNDESEEESGDKKGAFHNFIVYQLFFGLSWL